MSDPTAEAPPAQIPVDTIFSPPAEPPTTLGQTPHEPKTRPWEMELLLSGALVFSLMQLPGEVSAWSHRVLPTLDVGGYLVLKISSLYLQLALYSIVTGFSAHLMVRAYWVALIGLEAVFPGGIRWENSRSGPIVREVQRRRVPEMQVAIDRADRAASVVFASGIALAIFCVMALSMGILIAGLGFTVAHLLTREPLQALLISGVVAGVFAVVFSGGALLDRAFGARLAPESFGARAIRRITMISGWLQPTSIVTPLVGTITTNIRPRGVNRRVMVAFVVFAVVLVQAGGLSLRLDGYDFLPDDGGGDELSSRFYEDTQGTDGLGEVPTIQAQVVAGPYIRLFLPYRPLRHNAVIARECPAVARAAAGSNPYTPARPSGARATAAVLECLARLQPVTLDGVPLAASFHLFEQPGTGLRGIVAMIPTQGLTRGEHLLTVGRVPSIRATRTPLAPYRIPFWL